MTTFYAILIIIAVVGGILLLKKLLWKGVDAASKAANQKILYKTEYEEGLKMVSEPLIFETSASVSEIMHELTTHVIIVDKIPSALAAFYQTSFSEDSITYAYGSQIMAFFDAEVKFKKSGAKIEASFAILNYKERDGLIVGQDVMEKLRKQVQASFTAADANQFLKRESQSE